MDIRLLRTFTTVVRLGSFTGAADSLGYTQSAVSQHIAALETSLGITLFQRRPFAVTPAAQRLAEHANNILLRLDVATSEVAAIAARSITALATTPMAASTPEVARLLTLARRAEGAVSSVLSTFSADHVVALVARGECSAGVVDGVVGRHDPLGLADPGLLTALLLRVGSLAVVMPADHPFATQRSVAWSSVADAHWVEAPALMPHLGPGAADLLQRRKARARYEGSDPSVLGSLVAAGHGLALVPSSWNAGSSGAVAVALSEPALVHRVEMMVLRQRADEWNRLVSLVRSS